MKPSKIVLVFKTHFDIGFTDLSSRVIENYADGMLKEVIETCQSTQPMGKLKYVWTMPAWPLWHIVNSCEPELRQKLDALIENGQVVWHALPFTSHTDFCSQKEYLEGLRYSRLLSEKYHKPLPVSAKMTDVPGHSLMLPDILAGAGVKFLHLGCNEFATPPEVPDLFYWQTPGGRRVLTMYSRGGYGTGLVPPEGWNYPVWMALMHTQDNSGPQSAGAIMKMQEKIKAIYPEAEVVCGTMDDFYQELAKCDLSDVPVVEKDLADTWIHGVGSYPVEMAQVRKYRSRMDRLQALYAKRLLAGEEISPKVEELLNDYFEQICLFEEHTWGADVKTWLGPDRVYEKEEFLEEKRGEKYRFMEQSWDEQRDRAKKCGEILEQLEALLDAGDCKVFEESSDTLQVVETDGEASVENGRFRLAFDPQSGTILRVVDKKSGQPILESRENEGVFSYRYDKFGYDDINEYLRQYGYHFTTWGIQDYGRENYPFCDHETFVPVFEGYRTEQDRILFTYRNTESAKRYGDACRVTVEVELPGNRDDLKVTLRLERKQETPYVEAGSFLFPFASDKAQICIQKGGALIDPAKDIAEKANHSLYCLEGGLALWDEKRTLCIESKEAALAAIGTCGVYEYHPVFEEKGNKTVYVNLFNNMWGTNFPQWMGGDYSYSFVISSLDSADEEAVMETLLPKTEEILLPQGMRLIGAVQKEDGFILQLSDLSGKAQKRILKAEGFGIAEADLQHRIAGKSCEDSFEFVSVPYGIQSFFLKKKKEA